MRACRETDLPRIPIAAPRGTNAVVDIDGLDVSPLDNASLSRASIAAHPDLGPPWDESSTAIVDIDRLDVSPISIARVS